MNSVENEEISLYELYLVLKKRYKLIVSILAVSLFLTGIITYFERPLYRSSFTTKIPSVSVVENEKSERRPVISVVQLKKIIDELNFGLKNEKSPEVLSKKLGIGEEKARALSSLSVAAMKGDAMFFFDISVDVYDPQFTDELKSAILHFLDEHIVKEMTFLKNKSQLKRKELEASFKKMEEIRNIVFTQIKREGPKYIGFDPLQLERDLLDFKARMLDIEDDMRSLSGFEIVSEAMMPRKVRPRISVNFALAVMASLIVGIFLSFMLEWLEKNAKIVRHASDKEK